MERRVFLGAMGASAVTAWLPRAALAGAPGRYGNLLILVELKGGNDGLNTVVPYRGRRLLRACARASRIARDQVLQLDARAGLHPSLQPLMPLWQNGELAVVQGVGYPQRQSLALPLDRDLGYGFEEFRVSERWLVDARVCGCAGAARVRGRWRRRRLERHGAARRRRHARASRSRTPSSFYARRSWPGAKARRATRR